MIGSHSVTCAKTRTTAAAEGSSTVSSYLFSVTYGPFCATHFSRRLAIRNRVIMQGLNDIQCATVAATSIDMFRGPVEGVSLNALVDPVCLRFQLSPPIMFRIRSRSGAG